MGSELPPSREPVRTELEIQSLLVEEPAHSEWEQRQWADMQHELGEDIPLRHQVERPQRQHSPVVGIPPHWERPNWQEADTQRRRARQLLGDILRKELAAVQRVGMRQHRALVRRLRMLVRRAERWLESSLQFEPGRAELWLESILQFVPGREGEET
jgi:hypothetical protein